MQSDSLQTQCLAEELLFLKSFWTLRKDIGAKIKSKEISQRIFQNLTDARMWLSMNVAADLMEFLVFFYFLCFRDCIFICDILLQHEDFISCGWGAFFFSKSLWRNIFSCNQKYKHMCIYIYFIFELASLVIIAWFILGFYS